MDSLVEQLERIAADSVMVDLDDPRSLSKIHESLTNLSDAIGDETDIVSRAAQGCASLIEKIILNDIENKIEDKESVASILNDGITAMQAILRDKRELSEVRFPPELGLFDHSTEKGASASAPEVTETVEENAGVAKPEEPDAPPPESDVEPESLTMIVDGGDADLMSGFLNESREHCETAEQMMMNLETGSDCDAAINAIFRSFHTIKGASVFLDLKPVTVLAHELETLLDLARKGTVKIEGKSADIVFESIDIMRTLLDSVEKGFGTGVEIDSSPVVSGMLSTLRSFLKNPTEVPDETSENRVGDILVDMGVTSQKEIDEALKKKQDTKELLGETLVKQDVVTAKSVVHALRHQKMNREGDKAAASIVKEMVKIDTYRLDSLVDTIGELVIAESMVGQDDEFLATIPPRITKNITHLNKITRELQEMGMALRLVSVRPCFQKLARVVRDLTRKSGKKIELIMSGEDTEVDRSIIEKISDPLLHMIRNSVDHAIELPEDRIKAGKPETGHIWLRAYHKGGNIFFDIEDDGRGLDKDKILSKARDKGLLDFDKELSENEIYNLVLLPGFSTAKSVTEVSGRGVGMDVVKRNIDAMRGHLDIESKLQQGTKFTMRLPLTLAIIDGMLVRIEQERYIIPTVSVVESLHLDPEMIHTIAGKRELINLHGKLLPLIRIAILFGLSTEINHDSEAVVVIVEDSEKQYGLVVDELLGKRQTVIKSLGPVFAKYKWVSGGAILSDGSVGLIVDISGIGKLAKEIETGISETVSHSIEDDDYQSREIETSKEMEEIEELAVMSSS